MFILFLVATVAIYMLAHAASTQTKTYTEIPTTTATADKTQCELRVSGAVQSRYALHTVRDSEVQGWTSAQDLIGVYFLSNIQHELGIFGSVGEIGVHHGKFFIGLSMTSCLSETLFVCDLFSSLQHLNKDKSGSGDEFQFQFNLQKFGLDISQVVLFTGSSLDLKPDWFFKQKIPPFRLFSIDGGHTEDIVASDFALVNSIIADGSIIAVDDWINPGWPGVRAGGEAFLRSHPDTQIVPLAFWGKMLFTTKSHRDVYWRKMVEDPRMGQWVIASDYLEWGKQILVNNNKLSDPDDMDTAFLSLINHV